MQLTGKAFAEVEQDFKVYYTGNVIDYASSEKYIDVEANPISHSKYATVNFLGLSRANDYAYAILEIENGSLNNIDAVSVQIKESDSFFTGNSEVFDVDVIMCDKNGNQITDYAVPSGEKTYVKIFVQLLKTVTEYEEATIAVEILATPKEKPSEPVYEERERYLCQNIPIKAANGVAWSNIKNTFIFNKGSTLGQTIQYWEVLVVTNIDGKYIIMEYYPSGVIKKNIPIPTNGFALAFYDVESEYNLNLSSIDLTNGSTNEIIMKFSSGVSLDTLKNTTDTKMTKVYATFDIKITETIEIPPTGLDEEAIKIDRLPESPSDIFYDYYKPAEEKLKQMSLKEKAAQMYIVGGNPSDYANLTKYKFGGYLFFENYYLGKTKAQVQDEMNNLQSAIAVEGGIPLAMAIDEEGYTVSRLKNTKLIETPFQDACDIYEASGLNGIKQDVINKSTVLKDLGLNVNFAPVVDIADTDAYIYKRTLKQQEPSVVGNFAKTVIENSNGTGVTFSMKHFPGYGNSADTHEGFATDNRTFVEFKNKDFIPFKAGIDAGAQMIMFAHNFVPSMDDTYPSSISKNIHNVLRNELGYSGLTITDAINMEAIRAKYTTKEAIITAVNAGNDFICISMTASGQDDKVADEYGNLAHITYNDLVNIIADAVNRGEITEDTLNLAVRRILAWKYANGIITD